MSVLACFVLIYSYMRDMTAHHHTRNRVQVLFGNRSQTGVLRVGDRVEIARARPWDRHLRTSLLDKLRGLVPRGYLLLTVLALLSSICMYIFLLR